MKWVFLILFSLNAYADPFALKLLSEKKTLGQDGGSDKIVRVFEVEGTPFQMVQTTMLHSAVEVHDVEIFRGTQRETLAATSSYFVFIEGDTRSVTGRSYVKYDFAPDAKGIGELAVQPMIGIEKMSELKGVLSYSNYSEMDKERIRRGLPLTSESFQKLIADHSHFGRLMKARGYTADPSETVLDPIRAEVVVRFTDGKPRRRSLFPSLGECLGSLVRVLTGG